MCQKEHPSDIPVFGVLLLCTVYTLKKSKEAQLSLQGYLEHNRIRARGGTCNTFARRFFVDEDILRLSVCD